MILTTERLTMRPMRADDAEAMLRYRSIPEIASIIYSPVWTLEHAQQHIDKLLPKQGDPDSGFMRWMIELHEQSGVLGDVFLSKDEELQGTTEVGYVLHPEAHGKGYATEAVRAVIAFGFQNWPIHRMYARVDEENFGSIGVLRKLGMRQEARLIENDMRDGKWSNELIYAMLDREWASKHDQEKNLGQ